MQAPSKKYRVSLAVFFSISVVLLAGIYFYAITPQSMILRDVQKRLNEATNRYASAQQAQKKQTKLRLQERLAGLEQKLGEFVIESGKAAGLTFEISQIADDLKVEDFTSKRKEAFSQVVLEGFKDIGEVWIDISFNGDFHRFASFVNRLERHAPVVFVENFSVEKMANNSKNHQVKMGVSFFVSRDMVAGL